MVFRNHLGMKQNIGAIPSHIKEELKSDYYLNARKNTIYFNELHILLSEFNKIGIEVIVLKGASLASLVYQNLALRSMGDIDLLIKKLDLSRIDELLRRLGYASIDISAKNVDFSSTYLTTLDYRKGHQDSFSFHIHWHFVNSSVPNESYIKGVKMDNIWNDAEHVEIAGEKTLVMAPHHMLIHLSEHALRVRHSLSQLSLMCDINEVIRHYKKTLNWEKLIEESLDFKLNIFVYISLYFTSKYLGTEINKDVLARLKPEKIGLGVKFFLMSVSKNNRPSGLSYLIHLSINKGVKEKFNFLWKTFFPPRSIIRQRTNSPHSKQVIVRYLRRAGEILSGLLKFITQIVFSLFQRKHI